MPWLQQHAKARTNSFVLAVIGQAAVVGIGRDCTNLVQISKGMHRKRKTLRISLLIRGQHHVGRVHILDCNWQPEKWRDETSF